MHCRSVIALLAVVLCAGPALAQDGPPGAMPVIAPSDAQPTVKPAAKPAAPKTAVAKVVSPKTGVSKAALPNTASPKAATPKAAAAPAPGPAAAKPEPAKAKVHKTKIANTDATKPGTGKSDADKAAVAGDVLAGIPRDEQFAIQSALLWAGDYTGSGTNGDDAMLTAVKNFQARKKYKVTGTLSEAERAELVAAAKAHDDRVGWRVVIDPATGIRIGLPTKMVPHAKPDGSGTRWSSTHGDVQVATFRIKDANFAKLFEDEKKKLSRSVEYSVLRGDTFFVSGLQGLKKFSVRAQMRDGEIRGFTMLFDQMMETIVSPVMVAMASAFAPFPARSAPIAALARQVEYGTGLIVSADGSIVTDRRNTQGCQVIVAAGIGNAEQVAEDKDNGIALLRVYGARGLKAVALAQAPKESALTLAGIPDPQEQDGGTKIAEIKARLVGDNAIELRDPVPVAGFSGAAALDDQGRVLGIMETRNMVLASAGPAVPPVRLVSADTIRNFLAHNKVAVTQTASGSDARASIVRVICVRK